MPSLPLQSVQLLRQGISENGGDRSKGVFMIPWKLSLILLAGSLALTLFLWMIELPFFFLFLFIPFIPFFSGKEEVRRCPVCGWETTGSERFCPIDAALLEDDKPHGT